jgi:hypothetical protein
MKLDRLLTLSQFVDYINKTRPFLSDTPMSEEADNFATIVDYNNFLKQPLTKDMFVNPLSKPKGYHLYKNATSWALNTSEVIDCKEYEKAEKKVIFEGFKKSIHFRFDVVNGINIIDFSNCDYPKLTNYNKTVKTLHDLAEATKGLLTTKNIEL